MTDRPRTRTPVGVDVVATVLLAVAAVTTAWCGYQATRWSGEQAKTSALASATRFEAARALNLAYAQTQIDVATFSQWVDAYARGEPVLTDFYRTRFREEFRPAVDAWIATTPLKNSAAPLTPFAMPEYKLAATAEAGRLDEKAEALAADLRSYIQVASNYVLAVVLCAVALFFAGISTKLAALRLRAALLAVGCIVLLGTIAWVATFPVNVSV
jgi:hypothetical protein